MAAMHHRMIFDIKQACVAPLTLVPQFCLKSVCGQHMGTKIAYT